jgi:hypothetical protein
LGLRSVGVGIGADGLASSKLPPCRGTALIRNSAPLGPHDGTMPWALWRPLGGNLFLMSEVPLYKRDVQTLVHIRQGFRDHTHPKDLCHAFFTRRTSCETELPVCGQSQIETPARQAIGCPPKQACLLLLLLHLSSPELSDLSRHYTRAAQVRIAVLKRFSLSSRIWTFRMS